jgi:pSer/pThr/pTyr-binding forkhead associated (FHA) protein
VGKEFDISLQGLIIGRQADNCQIIVPDGRASSKHAWVGLENGRLFVIDEGSTNGTFINDMQQGRISKAELKEGDVVIIADPDVCSLTVTTR